MNSRRRRLQVLCRVGQNAPQKHPLGLVHRAVQRHAFTAPRATNRRTWTYRIRPSVTHRPYEEIPTRLIRSGPFLEVPTTPNQLRWDPLPIPEEKTDFVDGIVTLGGNGDPAMQVGVAIHLYAANASMRRSFLLHRRRRIADRAATGRAALPHRAWEFSRLRPERSA